MKSVYVVDYGIGNLLSVERALVTQGAKVTFTKDPEALVRASKIVLPGVGAFGNGMLELKRRNLVESIQETVNKGVPLLGICLGMQMLLDQSMEFGNYQGLGVIEGEVIPIPSPQDKDKRFKVPHVGWAPILPPQAAPTTHWEGSILESTKKNTPVYFVHSYMAMPASADQILANCLYEGQTLTAAIRKENVFGTQFHPEKSGAAGLKIISNFLEV